MSFYTALKLIWMFSIFKQMNLTNLNLKFKIKKFKKLLIFNCLFYTLFIKFF